MSKKSFLLVVALVIYESLVVVGLVAVVNWLTGLHSAPLLRGAAFLAAMGLFVPPLMLAIYLPYRQPAWLLGVQRSGQAAAAHVLANKARGDYWRPQDMGRYVRLPVQVSPPGQPPFTSELTCRLDQAQGLLPGSAIDVRYDQANPGRVALPAQG